MARGRVIHVPKLTLIAAVLVWLNGLTDAQMRELPAEAARLPREAVARGVAASLVKDERVRAVYPTRTVRCSGTNTRDGRCKLERHTPVGYTRRWCEYHGNCWE